MYIPIWLLSLILTGKTHTLMSSDGMTAHLISRLFARISRDNNNTYEVKSSSVFSI
jgi:hypothetical protein